MNKEDTVIEGSGNVFADLGYPNAEEHQTKAKLVSQIDPGGSRCAAWD